tara:strand:- start:85 stop:573 length:489 start_codon:yes stop_codon:yes gene_type:complete
MKNSGTKRKTQLSVLSVGIFCIFATSSCNRENVFARPGQGNGFSQNGQNLQGGQEEAKFEIPENLPVYRKNNLETLSIGRNRIEIEQMMGPPEGRSLDGGNGYLWDYRRPIYDEASDAVYGWSLVSFKFLKGLCAYVNIRLENPPIQLIQDPSGEKFARPGE